MNAPAELQQPPASIEAEQSVLGAILLDNTALDRINEIVSGGDFFRFGHRKIFEALQRMIEAGRTADLVTLAEVLKDDQTDECKTSYLGELMQHCPSSRNVVHYAKIVREKSIQRQLGMVCSDTLDTLYRPGHVNLEELLDTTESKIFELRETRQSGSSDIRSILARVVEDIDRKYHEDDPHKLPGTSTGFLDLDDMTGGMEPADLIIVAGRPSMGKTAFAMNVVEHVAVDEGLPVVVFSLEMGDKALGQRMLGSISRIDQHKLKRGRLTDEDWSRMNMAMGKLCEAPIVIEETTGLSIGGLRARARRVYREKGKLGLIVVDYLGLMAAPGETRSMGIGAVSRGLKALAKELDVPVMALSQLNRTLEARQNKRPILSDLRESGDIEQDADKVFFMYRDEEYNPNTLDKGLAEVVVGKNRNGPTGTVTLTWLPAFTRFENFAGVRPSGAAMKRRERGFQPLDARVGKDAAAGDRSADGS